MTEKTMSFPNSKSNGAHIAAILFLSVLFVSVLNPNIREAIRTQFTPKHHRTILAVATAPLDKSTKTLQILKVKTEVGLFIEVYDNQKLLSSAQLPDHRDGFFTFNGQVTNLAIDDVDNDKTNEILTTSFDQDLVAHLNIYRYNQGQKELELVRLN
ncbi:MAG: hypothetical protein IT289_03020 [Oligoflexia bacterium]|nr:hypothetical protein [Oligoflexia bacterium]